MLHCGLMLYCSNRAGNHTWRQMGARRILIVDDSASSRAALVEGLRSLSCVIVGEATDAHTGLGLVRRLRPDLVFIAIGLPERDGITVARQIMEEVPTPIVILSRHRDAETIRGATEAGVMTYLIKPLRNEELQPAIELAIGRFHEFTTLRNENANLKRALEEDHKFLLKGDVFTPDLIETWIDYKRKNEVDAIRLRPHPWEFALYFDI